MEKLKRFGPAAFVVAILVVIYYALKQDGPPPVVNTAPAYTPGASAVYQVGHNVPTPSPNLLFEAPALPPTPSYQNINNSPFITLMNGPAGAAATPGKASGDSCGCGGGCGCADTCNTSKGTFADGNGGTTLASNPARQAGSMTQAQVDRVALKVASLGYVGGNDYTGYAAAAALQAQRNQDLLSTFQSDTLQ